MEELQVIIDAEKPTLIAVTEAKPKNCTYEITKQDIRIPGFSLVWNLEQEGRLVCIYVLESDNITYRESNINQSIGFSECVWIQVKPNKEDTILVGCIYRSPNSSDANNEKLGDLIRAANSTEASHVLIMGDFNMPEIDWRGNPSGQQIL